MVAWKCMEVSLSLSLVLLPRFKAGKLRVAASLSPALVLLLGWINSFAVWRKTEKGSSRFCGLFLLSSSG